MKTSHQFALYDPTLPCISSGTLTITDHSIVHRMARVLRVRIHDQVVLFNKQYAITIRIINVYPQKIDTMVVSLQKVVPLKPALHILLPLLKKDDLEQACYGLAAVGATSITLISTQASHRKTIDPHEKDRLSRIIIAAAEQSKYFCFPEIFFGESLDKTVTRIASENPHAMRLVCDLAGQKLHILLNEFSLNQGIILLVGPEADITLQEKQFLATAHFIPCALTNTILLSQHAAFLAAGTIRSW